MTTPTTAADAWIAALRQAHDQLVEVVRRLDADGLARPSACAEWNVAQVLGHLGSGAEIWTGILDAALAGRDAPGGEANQPIWDRWNGLDDAAKAAAFLEHGEGLVARIEALDAAARAELPLKLAFFPEPVDVATYVRFRTSEVTYHGWDVRVAFDPTATLHPAAVDLMLDHAGDFFAYLGHAEALGGRPATIAVETTDPPRSSALVISDAVALVDAPAPPTATAPDAILRLPAEAWLRLTMGRLAPARTPAAVTLSRDGDGDGVTLDELRRVFPGI